MKNCVILPPTIERLASENNDTKSLTTFLFNNRCQNYQKIYLLARLDVFLLPLMPLETREVVYFLLGYYMIFVMAPPIKAKWEE